MTFKLPPYLVWRNGRPRWEPGPRLRPAWKGRDLKDDAGSWLGLEAAISEAHRINEDVAAWRAGGAPRRRRATQTRLQTCRDLFSAWQQSPKFERLAPYTRADYGRKIEIFLAVFGDHPVSALAKPHLYTWWEELHASRGHAMANSTVAVVRSMLTYATLKGWRPDNPAFNLRLNGVAPRLVIWLPAEVEAFVSAATALGMPNIADAVIVALHSGQRQGDVLRLPRRIFEPDRIRLSTIRLTLRQSKRGAIVDAPMTPALRARVEDIRARQAANAVIGLDGPLILRADGKPYNTFSLSREFRPVRAAAAQTVPSIADKRFQDLRDTAVTRLALAGCNLNEIAAITGHAMKSIAEILRHYLALQPEMATSAIGKLTCWLEEQGIAI